MDSGIKPLRFLYALPRWNIERVQATKKGNSEGAMGSKSKRNLMNSYKISKKVEEQKLKKQQKENALDIISKSINKNIKTYYLNGSGSLFINLPVGR